MPPKAIWGAKLKGKNGNKTNHIIYTLQYLRIFIPRLMDEMAIKILSGTNFNIDYLKPS